MPLEHRKQPFTNQRKSYFENLRKNHVPRYLFRVWSSNSGGGSRYTINSKSEVIPHGFMHGRQGHRFYDMTESEILIMASAHYGGRTTILSEFSSWASSLHLVLCYAEHIVNTQRYDPYVALIDTHALNDEVLIWHAPHLLGYGYHEYLAHGCIRGNGYVVVRYAEMKKAGLFKIFPELKKRNEQFGHGRRQNMFKKERVKPAARTLATSRRVASLFGHLYLPMATALLCLRPRPWLHGAITKKEDINEILNTLLDSDSTTLAELSAESWLVDGMVNTNHFDDVRQWITLLSALSKHEATQLKQQEPVKKSPRPKHFSEVQKPPLGQKRPLDQDLTREDASAEEETPKKRKKMAEEATPIIKEER